MKIVHIAILINCILSALTCSAKKYQIKVLNTPTITIDKKEAKVGDWFDDQSVIVWSRDNQAMRVVSEDNKVYTLSAKLYKESKSKKFADFIIYTKPLAARGANDQDLIEQLAERFEQDFIMLDEIVIDLSDIELPENATFRFYLSNHINSKKEYIEVIPIDKRIEFSRSYMLQICENEKSEISLSVMLCRESDIYDVISEFFPIIVLPTTLE